MSSGHTSSEDSASRASFAPEEQTIEISGAEAVRPKSRGAGKHQISKDDFYRETDDKTRGALAAAAASAMLDFLGRDRAVFIENFGIIFPEIRSEIRAHIEAENLFLRCEKTRLANFEKTDDLTASHRECFPSMVETRDLAAAAYAKLPLEIQLILDPAEIRRLLRGLFKAIRHEVVAKGFSPWLSPVGDFFAVHNRQGLSAADWYAGADIFLVPRNVEPLEIGPSRRMPRPVLDSAHEIFDCASGAAIKTWPICPLRELSELGLVIADEDQKNKVEFEVRAYRYAENGARPRIVYATDGIRLKKNLKGAPGSEFVVCLGVESDDINGADIPEWPLKALAMAWALDAHVSPEQGLKVGLGLSAEEPIFVNKHGRGIKTIMLSEFHLVSLEQLSTEGPFRFFSVIPLLEEESKFAEQRGSSHLLSVLRHKGTTRLCQEHRDSVLA